MIVQALSTVQCRCKHAVALGCQLLLSAALLMAAVERMHADGCSEITPSMSVDSALDGELVDDHSVKMSCMVSSVQHQLLGRGQCSSSRAEAWSSSSRGSRGQLHWCLNRRAATLRLTAALRESGTRQQGEASAAHLLLSKHARQRNTLRQHSTPHSHTSTRWRSSLSPCRATASSSTQWSNSALQSLHDPPL